MTPVASPGGASGTRGYRHEDHESSRRQRLRYIGSSSVVDFPLLAIFSARNIPPELILPSLDLAVRLREAVRPVVGGFQSEIERGMLRLMLRGSQAVAVCPARSIDRFRVPRAWRQAIAEERLVIASALPTHLDRASAATAALRNRTVLTLARGIFVLHGKPGSQTFALAVEALDVGMPVDCFDHSTNRDLLLLGARPVPLPTPYDRQDCIA